MMFGNGALALWKPVQLARQFCLRMCVYIGWEELRDGGGGICDSGPAMQGLWENYERSSYVMRMHSQGWGIENQKHIQEQNVYVFIMI